jgi:hypothetical protein
VDRHAPGLAELSFSNAKNVDLEIHIVSIQGERLANTHAGHGEEPEDRRERQSTQATLRRE